MRAQEKLVDLPHEIAITWQEDAAQVVEDFVVHSFTKDFRHIPEKEIHEREKALRDRAIDLLFRAGRLG